MEINFITGNLNKLNELKEILEPEITVRNIDLDLDEEQTLDQDAIAYSKVIQSFTKTNKPVVVDDTAIFISKFESFPGTLTKFVLQGIGIDGILKLIDENDKAYFRTILFYKDSEKEIKAEGLIKGKLTKNKSANFNPKAPFNSIFIPDGYLATISDLDKDFLKNFSSRAVAAKNLKDNLIK